MQNWGRASLSEDSCPDVEEGLSESLSGISEQAISKRLKQSGMTEKDGYWVLHELKPRRDVERRLFACEQLVEKQEQKGFLHRIVTCQNGYITITLTLTKAQKIIRIAR
nr:Mariner Mos1 transposase [Hymenolepis microstoma]